MKLSERVARLEARLTELEGLVAKAAPKSRVEAARAAGKRSAEVRRARNGSAQPKASPGAAPPAPVEAIPECADLAAVCQGLLDNPTEVYRLRPAVLSAVQRITKAWTAPFGIAFMRIGDSPSADADLRAMLTALAAGYSVEDLERAGERALSDEELLEEFSPGPSSFTRDVLLRLIGAPEKA